MFFFLSATSLLFKYMINPFLLKTKSTTVFLIFKSYIQIWNLRMSICMDSVFLVYGKYFICLHYGIGHGFEAVEQLGFIYHCLNVNMNSHSFFSLDFWVNIERHIILIYSHLNPDKTIKIIHLVASRELPHAVWKQGHAHPSVHKHLRPHG